MEGGGTGTCGEDYNTCAHFLVAVVCPELKAPTALQLGDLCASGALTADGLNASECPNCTACMSVPGQAGLAGSLLIHTCQVPDAPAELPPLEVGDLCKSGGVETGPGVDRMYDCPVGSSCLPVPDSFAIGGEVNHTCQEVTTTIPSGGACTLSGTRGSPAMPCDAGLECIITNPGRPEVDIPNAGICLDNTTALGFAVACNRGAQGTACAPTLRCVWTHTTFPSSTGYTCQHAGTIAAPPESCDGNTDSSTTTEAPEPVAESGAPLAASALTAFYVLGGVVSTLLASH